MSKNISFVLCADKNYINPLCITVFSIVKNLPKDILCNFYIFSQNFNDNNIVNLKKLEKRFKCKITNIPMENYINFFKFADIGSFKCDWISIACYFRLLIFEILPHDIEECFYIDSDIIVDTDLSQLKLSQDKIFACVPGINEMEHREKHFKHLKEWSEFKKYHSDELKYSYFNAGFFLTNVRKAKELNAMYLIRNFLTKYPKPPYADQDVLNAIFGQYFSDLIEYLPPQYNLNLDSKLNYKKEFNNLPFSDKELKKALLKPKILHFAGRVKPWKKFGCKYTIKYWQYYFSSPYKTQALKDLFNILFDLENFILFKKARLIYMALKHTLN